MGYGKGEKNLGKEKLSAGEKKKAVPKIERREVKNKEK